MATTAVESEVRLLELLKQRPGPANQQATPLARLRSQECHLVAEEVAILEDEALGAIRCIGHGQQTQTEVLEHPISLAVIAGATGCCHVFPGIGSAQRHRNDMISSQKTRRQHVPAV